MKKLPDDSATMASPGLRKAIVVLCIVMILCLTGLLLFLYVRKQSSREIRIGVVLPLSGIRSRFGIAIQRGIEMAVEDINNLQALDKKLVCVFADDCSDPLCAEKAAKKLVSHDDVIALIGSYSNLCTLKVCEVAEKKKTPLISPISSGEEISRKGYRWVFRTNAPSSRYALSLLDFLTTEAGCYSIAFLYETDNAGKDFALFTRTYAKDLRCRLVYVKGFENGLPDFTPMLKEVKKLHPDALLVSAHIEDALHLMKDARALKLRPRAFAGMGSGFSLPDFITLGGHDVERTFSAVQWNPRVKWPGAIEFGEKFKKRYGIYPDEHSANLYAAVQVLATSLAKQKPKNREQLRRALQEVDANTIFGRIRFEYFEDFSNQNSHSTLIQQVQGGKYVTVWPKALRNAKPVFPK